MVAQTHESQTRSYPSGVISLAIRVDSGHDNSVMADVPADILTTGIAIADSVLALRELSSDETPDPAHPTSQSYVTTLSFNDTTVMIRIEITLNGETSERTLTVLAVGAILPKILEAVAYYLGNA